MHLALALLCLVPQAPQVPADELALVPLPLSIERQEGTFTLSESTRILSDKDDPGATSAAAAFLIATRPATGFPLVASALEGERPKGSVLFTHAGADPALGEEGYVLEVGADGAIVRASAAAGLYHGAQTLLQLFPPAIFARAPQKDIVWSAPALTIRDMPRFAWRGVLLDVSRHFFTKDEVKRVLDQMALVKLNVLHWHLVDDHGWRIEIKKYPKLTEVGAWRDGVGFGLDPKSTTAYGKDGKYGGFYTQEEIREIVGYAAARAITIVPEIEMPGHSVAALAAYPEYSCSGGPFDRNVPAGVHAGIYCPGNDATFGFLEDVLGEVFTLFPGTFVHLGGDEVPREEWQKCAKCKARMDSEHLQGVAELQSWFLKRMERFVNAKKRRVIGWDEILDGGLAPNAAVMSWRGTDGGLAAASAGHDVVMTPTSSLYFDYLQAQQGEPRGIGGFVPLEQVYAYDPVPAGLAPANLAHVLGAQGNLWTEYIPNLAHAEYMLWPRSGALAEITWSPAAKRNLDSFLGRMRVQLERMNHLGAHYRVLPPPGLESALVFEAGSPPKLRLATKFPLEKALVSFDGSDPAIEGKPIAGALSLPNGNCRVRVRLYRANSSDSYLCEALVVQGKARVSTSLGAEGTHPMAQAFDLDPVSFYWTDRNVRRDDHVTLEFFAPRVMKHAKVTTGDADKPKDTLQEGVLEMLPDGGKWTELAEFKGGVVDCDLPPLPLLALRLRATKDQQNWMRVHEFAFE